MRILRQFNLPDLVATAEIGKANARKYVIGLRRAGYLVLAREKDDSRAGGHAVYRLVRDSGAKAPRLQSDGDTYDPNIHQVYPGGLTQNGEAHSE
jgi:site-specific DNA-methyltransferase (adenine-specific)